MLRVGELQGQRVLALHAGDVESKAEAVGTRGVTTMGQDAAWAGKLKSAARTRERADPTQLDAVSTCSVQRLRDHRVPMCGRRVDGLLKRCLAHFSAQ